MSEPITACEGLGKGKWELLIHHMIAVGLVYFSGGDSRIHLADRSLF